MPPRDTDTDGDLVAGVPVRLGYLLKHVQLRYTHRSVVALRPLGIDARELATLACLGGAQPLSQQQAAHVLGIDRTSMVSLVDSLESKGLVRRGAHPQDRRKNVLELTPAGHDIRERATAAADDAERGFLEHLGPDRARELKESLRDLLT